MRKYSCNSEQGVIYSAEVGDTRRAREYFTEEIVTALALKGPGIDSVEKVGNGVLHRGTSMCKGTEACSGNWKCLELLDPKAGGTK